MTSSRDWTEVVGAVGLFALLITVIVVVAVQVGKRRRARSAEYRALAELMVTGQESISRQLAEVNEHLADLRTRMAHVEAVLEQVE